MIKRWENFVWDSLAMFKTEQIINQWESEFIQIEENRKIWKPRISLVKSDILIKKVTNIIYNRMVEKKYTCNWP